MKSNKPTQSLEDSIKEILNIKDENYELYCGKYKVMAYESDRKRINKLMSLFSQEQKRLLQLVNEKVIGEDEIEITIREDGEWHYLKGWGGYKYGMPQDFKKGQIAVGRDELRKEQREALNKLESEEL